MSKKNKYLLLGALVVLFSYITTYSQKSSFLPQSKISQVQNQTSSPSASLVMVTRVIDGDTIVVEGDRHVRLIGMDTPELTGSAAAKCFGTEAKAYMEKLLVGQSVRMEKDVSEVDKYGRLLRYIYLGDEMIDNKLVREGFARVATYPPDVKYQQMFLDSEEYAREKGLGLWGKCGQ